MNTNEEKLIESFNVLESLFKERFNDSFNGIAEYIDRMNFHNDEGLNVISDWALTLQQLIDINTKINVINKGKKESETELKDIDFIIQFIEDVKDRKDPLQEYYLKKNYIKETDMDINEEEPVIEYEDLEYSTYKSYRSLFKIAPVTITIVVIVVILLWVYMRLNARLL